MESKKIRAVRRLAHHGATEGERDAAREALKRLGVPLDEPSPSWRPFNASTNETYDPEKMRQAWEDLLRDSRLWGDASRADPVPVEATVFGVRVKMTQSDLDALRSDASLYGTVMIRKVYGSGGVTHERIAPSRIRVDS